MRELHVILSWCAVVATTWADPSGRYHIHHHIHHSLWCRRRRCRRGYFFGSQHGALSKVAFTSSSSSLLSLLLLLSRNNSNGLPHRPGATDSNQQRRARVPCWYRTRLTLGSSRATPDGEIPETPPPATAATFASPLIPPPPPISVPVWSLAAPRIGGTLAPENDSSSSSSSNPFLPPSLPPPSLPPPTSMNIVTFATAVSVAPPPSHARWIVSLYYHTLTKDSFVAARRGVLQLLRPAQQDLVAVLGKHSGYRRTHHHHDDHQNHENPHQHDNPHDDPIGSNKAQACATAGWPWVEATEFAGCPLQLLPKCALYMVLEQECQGDARNNNNNSTTTTTMDAGDHVVVLCRVVRTGTWDESSQQIVPLGEANHDDDDNKNSSSTIRALTTGLGPDHVLYTGYLRQVGLL